jgi:hypothetical protein
MMNATTMRGTAPCAVAPPGGRMRPQREGSPRSGGGGTLFTSGRDARTTRGSSRLGASLISALIALTVIAVCSALLLQTSLMGSMLRNRVGTRARALAACQTEMESLRAAGMSSLPAFGVHAFDTGTASLHGQTTVAPGPADGTRTVTVTVSWQPAQRLPAGRVELATIFSARGLTP